MRRIVFIAGALALAGVLVASVGAGTIVGSKKNDVLRGTAKADTMNGKAGNDTLFGLAGNDKLVGGPGNDKLVGGKGKDRYSCGPGKDVVMADGSDVRPGADCETITGLQKPAISIGDASAAEGNSGTTNLSFTLSLSSASSSTVSVSFATADGTATTPADYATASGKVTFQPGQTSKTVDVPIVGDLVVEQDETFTVALSAPANATIAGGSAMGTIKNDDLAPRSGHYAGTTSQGRSIAFDVAPDVKSLSNMIFYVDLSCPELPGSIPNAQIDLTYVSFPISPSWSFAFNIPYSNPNVEPGTVTVALSGKLSMPGNANGTLRVNLTQNLPVFGDVHCSSGDVTWNAS